jgi:hypothetical protein
MPLYRGDSLGADGDVAAILVCRVGNDSDRLTFIDLRNASHTLPKYQPFQGFRSDATVINVIFRT